MNPHTPYTPITHECYCECQLFRMINKVQAPHTRPQTYSICNNCGAETTMWGNPLGYADVEPTFVIKELL